VAKAFAVKAVALVAIVAAFALLSTHAAVIATIAILVATIGFLTYAIAWPSAQFFAPVVHHLTGPVVALTFDDGPDPVWTPRLLDLLAARGARATFFVLGERAARHPDVVRRIHAEGHSVGTHTQHHTLKFHFASAAYVEREIAEAIAVVAAIVPEPPRLFRPPQGLRTPSFAAGWQRTRDLTCVTWSVRGLDSLQTTAAKIVARITPRLEPGAIVTLHDGTGLGGGDDRGPTLAALATILDRCAELGLRCVALGPTGAPR
jgi:peptidoglycan/xylan/chitin deacetylase (PgdA/CDA1 family)